jgi:hypothetical protein
VKRLKEFSAAKNVSSSKISTDDTQFGLKSLAIWSVGHRKFRSGKSKTVKLKNRHRHETLKQG